MCKVDLVQDEHIWAYVVKKYINGRLDTYVLDGIALWSCIETTIWTFNPLATIEVYYIEKNPLLFSHKKNIFSTEERNTWTSWITWGWVNYQETFILEVNYSIKGHSNQPEIDLLV